MSRPGERGETNPIPGNAGRDGAAGAWNAGKMCKTNPIRPGLGRSRVPRRAKDAKRTQFGPAWAGLGHGRAKDAKRTQFPATPGGTGPQERGTRGKCAKRTQLRTRAAEATARGGTGPEGREPWGCCTNAAGGTWGRRFFPRPSPPGPPAFPGLLVFQGRFLYARFESSYGDPMGFLL